MIALAALLDEEVGQVLAHKNGRICVADHFKGGARSQRSHFEDVLLRVELRAPERQRLRLDQRDEWPATLVYIRRQHLEHVFERAPLKIGGADPHVVAIECEGA